MQSAGGVDTGTDGGSFDETVAVRDCSNVSSILALSSVLLAMLGCEDSNRDVVAVDVSVDLSLGIEVVAEESKIGRVEAM